MLRLRIVFLKTASGQIAGCSPLHIQNNPKKQHNFKGPLVLDYKKIPLKKATQNILLFCILNCARVGKIQILQTLGSIYYVIFKLLVFPGLVSITKDLKV